MNIDIAGLIYIFFIEHLKPLRGFISKFKFDFDSIVMLEMKYITLKLWRL